MGKWRTKECGIRSAELGDGRERPSIGYLPSRTVTYPPARPAHRPASEIEPRISRIARIRKSRFHRGVLIRFIRDIRGSNSFVFSPRQTHAVEPHPKRERGIKSVSGPCAKSNRMRSKLTTPLLPVSAQSAISARIRSDFCPIPNRAPTCTQRAPNVHPTCTQRVPNRSLFDPFSIPFRHPAVTSICLKMLVLLEIAEICHRKQRLSFDSNRLRNIFATQDRLVSRGRLGNFSTSVPGVRQSLA
jgi:hypothetical protein